MLILYEKFITCVRTRRFTSCWKRKIQWKTDLFTSATQVYLKEKTCKMWDEISEIPFFTSKQEKVNLVKGTDGYEGFGTSKKSDEEVLKCRIFLCCTTIWEVRSWTKLATKMIITIMNFLLTWIGRRCEIALIF